MVTQKQIESNMKKLVELQNKVLQMMSIHETALFTYQVDGEDKFLPPEDVEALIAKYQSLKVELQQLYSELL